jgi:hypothetical protein
MQASARAGQTELSVLHGRKQAPLILELTFITQRKAVGAVDFRRALPALLPQVFKPHVADSHVLKVRSFFDRASLGILM